MIIDRQPVQAPVDTILTPNSDLQEELHAEDMAAKQEAVSEFNGESSPTVDLLRPEVELDIVSEEVVYDDQWTVWYFSYPQDDPDAPGVVVIHEWRGLNDHIKDMTKVLAQNGYKALAVDLYQWVVANEFEQARELSSSLDQEFATTNLLAAEEFLRNESSAKVASLGRCMWGKQSLQMSLASETLDSTVIYYGFLETDPELLANVQAPILGIFAENDNGIPPSMVGDFQQGLAEAGVEDVSVTIYKDVDHAFANPTWSNYSEEETIDAWEKTLAFLESSLSK